MYNAKQIAHYFIYKSNPYSNENITNLKLQKLLYYAQGHYLVENSGNPLFKNEIEAWVHGPVVRDVYSQYSHYNFNVIENDVNLEMIADIEDETKELLDQVWDKYKKYNGKQLELMTHQESPWKDIRGDLPPFVYTDDPIPLREIQNYFTNHNLL